MFPYFLNMHVSVSFRQCIDHACFVSSSSYLYFLAVYQESIGITKRTLLLSPPPPPPKLPSPRSQLKMDTSLSLTPKYYILLLDILHEIGHTVLLKQ